MFNGNDRYSIEKLFILFSRVNIGWIYDILHRYKFGILPGMKMMLMMMKNMAKFRAFFVFISFFFFVLYDRCCCYLNCSSSINFTMENIKKNYSFLLLVCFLAMVCYIFADFAAVADGLVSKLYDCEYLYNLSS